MTISSDVRTAGPFLGAGLTGPFPFTFKVFSAADLVVVQADVAGVELVLSLSLHYTVALNADQNTSPGGVVNLLTALPVGQKLLLGSNLPALQPAALPNGGPYFARVIEDALDRLTVLAQQAAFGVRRALRVPETNGVLDIPAIAARAGKFLAFNSAGDPIAVTVGTPGDAAALAVDLANTTTPGKGAGQVGFSPAVVYTGTSIGAFLRSLATAAGAAFLGFVQAGVSAVVRTVQAKLRETVTPQDFGAVGDGVTDDTAALLALAAYVNAFTLFPRPITVRFPTGVYKYGTSMVFTRPVHIDSDAGAMLNYIGIGYALQLAPDGTANFDVFLQGEYSVDGLRFTGGASCTHGIYLNAYVLEPRLRNITFEDFGNSTSIDIYAQFEDWNILIQNCRKLTFSSLVAVGNFIRIEGRKRDLSAYDGGNSRVSIVDCWMTSYAGQELGYFAYINCVKGIIRGGGYQVSRGGIILGPLASGAVIDSVYCELSATSNPYYVQAQSASAGGGNYHQPQQVVIRNGYCNMHQEVIGSTGRLVKAADANVRLLGWVVEDMSITSFANGQPLVEQNDLTGQANNIIRNVRPLFIPAASDNTWRFKTRAAGYTNAEEWYEANYDDGISLGTPSRVDATGNRARLNIRGTTVDGDSALNIAEVGDGMSMGIKSRLSAVAALDAGWHHRVYRGNGAPVGGVYSSGATTSFATSSDYRLKSSVVPLAESGAFIDALRPRSWFWAADGKPGAGFIAHELAEVAPTAVIGEKDAANADGSIAPQSADSASPEIIAHIVAELQSLRQRVATLGL